MAQMPGMSQTPGMAQSPEMAQTPGMAQSPEMAQTPPAPQTPPTPPAPQTPPTPPGQMYEPSPQVPAGPSFALPKRTAKQRGSDESVKAFRERVNPMYIEMFRNLPQATRPKGIPVTVARQAIQMSEEEQDRLIKNVADERRNAIEIKLGRKTRKVDSSTLNDIESILKMAEKSLITEYPDKRPLIRRFGRETRKIARNYTGREIQTLVTPRFRSTNRRDRPSINSRNSYSRRSNSRRPASATTAFRSKNNVVNSLENASPPQYNE